MSVCSYSSLRNNPSPAEIDKRFRELYQNVCFLLSQGGSGGSQSWDQTLAVNNVTTRNFFLDRSYGEYYVLGIDGAQKFVEGIQHNSGDFGNLVVDPTDAYYQVHGVSATEGFLRANNDETWLSVNAPNDEGNTKLVQNATKGYLKTRAANGGVQQLNFIDDADFGASDDFQLTLPTATGYLVTSVNNALADVTGNVVLSAYTGDINTGVGGDTIHVINGIITGIN